MCSPSCSHISHDGKADLIHPFDKVILKEKVLTSAEGDPVISLVHSAADDLQRMSGPAGYCKMPGADSRPAAVKIIPCQHFLGIGDKLSYNRFA